MLTRKRRPSLEDLEQALEAVMTEIGAHPYNSTQMIEAQAIVKTIGKDDVEGIEAAYAERGLPPMAEIGLITVKGMRSFARLHRRRVRLEKRIARARRRGSGLSTS